MSAQFKQRDRTASREALWLDDGGRCHYCRADVAFPGIGTIDHVVPRGFGGTNHRWNLVFACEPCNGRLGDTTNKCRCRKCEQARQRFHKTKAIRSNVTVQPKGVVQWVTPRRIESVRTELERRVERAVRQLDRLDDVDSPHAAAIRGRILGYRHVLVLLAAAYDDEASPEMLAELGKM